MVAASSGQRYRGQRVECGRHCHPFQTATAALPIDPLHGEGTVCPPATSQLVPIAPPHIQVRAAYSANAACKTDRPDETYRYLSLDVSKAFREGYRVSLPDVGIDVDRAGFDGTVKA